MESVVEGGRVDFKVVAELELRGELTSASGDGAVHAHESHVMWCSQRVNRRGIELHSEVIWTRRNIITAAWLAALIYTRDNHMRFRQPK